MKIRGLIFIAIPLLIACSNNTTEIVSTDNMPGFKHEIINDSIWITSGRGTMKHVTKIPANFKTAPRIVSLSSTALAFMDLLGMTDLLVGVSDTPFVQITAVKERIRKGEIKSTGNAGIIDYEIVLLLKPDFILSGELSEPDYKKLCNLGLQVINIEEYLETSPLKRLEWIKCIGYLGDKEEKAISYCDSISKLYGQVVESVSVIKNKPIVFSGSRANGGWYLPGGNSYIAQMISDAGGTYSFQENQRNGSLQVDFETGYLQAERADFWRIQVYKQGNYTVNDLLKEDLRYADLKMVKENRIIVSNVFYDDYYGKGMIEPHIILKDLVKCIHPELNDTSSSVYYRIISMQ